MRFLVVHVVFGLLIATCQSHTSIKFSIAIHCPSGELDSWHGAIFKKINGGYTDIAYAFGTTSENFVFVELIGEVSSSKEPAVLDISVSSNCKGGRSSIKIDRGISIQDDKGSHYGFRVYNMENAEDKTDSKTYEYLFMKYLEKDCEKNGCKESSREYVVKGCDFFKKESEQCMKGYDDTLQKYCQKEGSSGSTTSSTKMIIIIGGAVGAIIILVLAITVFFYCRKKRKSKQKGTGTMSGSIAPSGTTKQSTANNNFNSGAPTGAPTPTEDATITGVERY